MFHVLIGFESEHYVPIATEDASTDFQVAVLDTKKWKNKLCRPGSFTSKDFRQKALYKSNIRRVSGNFNSFCLLIIS